MGRRRRIDVPGLDHPGQPIPAAVAGGGWVLSSPIGPRPLGGGPIPSSLDEQLVLTFANLGRVLDAAGIGPDDVMFVRVFVAELGVRTAFNESWSAFFGADGPARQVTEQRLPEGAQVLLRFMALEPA
jgi:enamine deaminase RidA (YjgF/YER057c/UK114 family)